jgi:hypothetical protein
MVAYFGFGLALASRVYVSRFYAFRVYVSRVYVFRVYVSRV